MEDITLVVLVKLSRVADIVFCVDLARAISRLFGYVTTIIDLAIPRQVALPTPRISVMVVTVTAPPQTPVAIIPIPMVKVLVEKL